MLRVPILLMDLLILAKRTSPSPDKTVAEQCNTSLTSVIPQLTRFLNKLNNMARSGYQVNQNCDNFLREKPSTRLHAPPGGGSSVGSLIYGGGETESPFAGRERKTGRKMVTPESANPYSKTPSTFNQPAPSQPPNGLVRASSNQYACGTNQNAGNVLTDRRITRIHAPPGGASSFRLG